MNTILLQKILDLLKDNLTGAGTFIKSIFVHDPQDNQILSYDAEIGKWVNKDATEVELDFTNTFEAQTIATITDGAENVPMKSLICEIVPKETGTGTKSPSNPYVISGTDEIVITHTYGDNETETKTINLPSTVYGGEVDIISGQGEETYGIVDMGSLSWSTGTAGSIPVYVVYNFTDAKAPSSNNDNPKLLSDIYTSVSRTNLTSASEEITLSTINALMVATAETYADATAFKNAMVGHKLVYPLATPTPITTTPTTIKTQGGTENIWSDTGDVSGEYYTKTAESVLALANITEDITSSITKNTTEFSDILLKVSQNNKVVSIEIYSASTSSALIGTFLSNLPKPAMNSKVLLANTTVGEDGIILGTLKTTGELEIATTGAKSFSGLITYVAK